MLVCRLNTPPEEGLEEDFGLDKSHRGDSLYGHHMFLCGRLVDPIFDNNVDKIRHY